MQPRQGRCYIFVDSCASHHTSHIPVIKSQSVSVHIQGRVSHKGPKAKGGIVGPSQNLFTKVRCYFNCQKISRQEGHYCCFKICLYVFFIFSSSSAVPWNWAGYSDSFPTKRIWWSAGEWLLRQKALGASLCCLAWITHSEETSGQVTRTLKQSCWTGCVSRNRERAPVKSQPRVSANN